MATAMYLEHYLDSERGAGAAEGAGPGPGPGPGWGWWDWGGGGSAGIKTAPRAARGSGGSGAVVTSSRGARLRHRCALGSGTVRPWRLWG